MNLGGRNLRDRVAWLALLTIFGGARATAATDDGSGWKLTWLELDVGLRPDARWMEVAGSANLERLSGSSRAATLVLNGEQPLFRFVEGGCEGATVRLEHAPWIAPTRSLLHVELDVPASQGQEIEVTFRYESVGTWGSQTLVEPGIALASWVEWWTPTPRARPDEDTTAAMAAAPGLTQIAMPAGWSAVTSGERIERVESDAGVIEVYEDSAAVARSFAAAAYHVTSHRFGGREIGVYRLEVDPAAEVQARSLAQALVAMEDRFGPFPYATCHLAEVPPGLSSWYAASQQGFIMAQSAAFQYGANLPLFAHEASHGWWGNRVNTRGPGGILCSESLAQYGAVIAIETVEGPDALQTFLDFSRAGYVPDQCARGYFEILRSGEDLPLSSLAGQPQAHSLSDAKGHWVYHMLRHVVGDEVFFATLRGLLERFAGQRMGLDDVRAAFQVAAPGRRLADFFAQWLDREGAPVIDASFEQAGESLRLTLRQSGEPFDLDLEVAVETDAGVTRHEVALRGSQTTVELSATSPVLGVHLDPDRHFLIWRPEYGPRP